VDGLDKVVFDIDTQPKSSGDPIVPGLCRLKFKERRRSARQFAGYYHTQERGSSKEAAV
jgi:hypothetical protein